MKGRLLLSVVIGLASASPAPAQPAARDVMDAALERVRADTRGTDEITLDLLVNGKPATVHLLRQGHPSGSTWEPTVVRAEGVPQDRNLVLVLMEAFLEGERVLGEPAPDGRLLPTAADGRRVLTFTRGSLDGMAPPDVPQGVQTFPRETIYLDPANSDIARRVTADWTVRGDRLHPVLTTLELSDRRTLQGVRFPYLLRLAIDGVVPPHPVAERKATAERLANERRALASLPEVEREAAEAAIRFNERLLEGVVEITARVVEVRVNRDPAAARPR